MRTFRMKAFLLLWLVLAMGLAPLPSRASGDWYSGVGAIHLGGQLGTADKAGNLVSGYLGGDFALLQKGVDLGVMSFLVLGAGVSTLGHVLGIFTPIAFGSDQFQFGVDLLWSPSRDATESPFGISLRIPLTFH
jgi:hypothetical protein